jgi:hypothetical protein
MPFSAGDVLGAAALNAALYLKPVRVATTGNGTLASAYENGDTLDGVTLATGNRILLKDQTSGSDNGIYTVNASGAPTRALDFDVSAEVLPGMCVVVSEGTSNKDSVWQLTTNASITLGSTALVFFPIHMQGTGSPESAVTAPVGATFRRTDGSTGTTLYVKESGTGATGWVAVAASTGGMTKIAESTLGSAGAIQFAAIPGTYRSLMLVIEARSASAVGADNCFIRFNGDSGSNYDNELLTASAATPASAELLAASRTLLGQIPGTTAAAGSVGSVSCIIPDYAGTTWQKTLTATGANALGTSSGDIRAVQSAGRWRNTAAITQIDIAADGGNLITGSRATLYGLST